MKKIVLIFIYLSIVLSVYAQFNVYANFKGAFYHADPEAWVDKEPYFACQNLYTFYNMGQNLQNVSIVINGTDVYSYPYIWEYGKYITIGAENGIHFSSGDEVTLRIGNQYINTWTYRTKSALPDIKLIGAGKILKSVWKYIKRIR